MDIKRTILVDMDGVLVDLLPAWLHEYGTRSGEWVHQDRVIQYHHEQYVSDPEVFFQCLETALETATPCKGSLTLNALLGANLTYDVRIVTYAHPSAVNAHKIKIDWLEQYFPSLNPEDIIFTGHKDLVRGDVLIEDSPEKLDKWLDANRQGWGIIIDQQYNQDYGHIRCSRANSFADVPMILAHIFEGDNNASK